METGGSVLHGHPSLFADHRAVVGSLVHPALFCKFGKRQVLLDRSSRPDDSLLLLVVEMNTAWCWRLSRSARSLAGIAPNQLPGIKPLIDPVSDIIHGLIFFVISC